MCAAPLPSAPNLPSLALLETAAELLAERGPSRVTPDCIATRAGVSVHTVRAVWPEPLDATRAALDYLDGCIAGALGPERPGEKLGDLIARALRATEQNQRFWRILTWCLLEGHHPMDLKRDFPVIQRLVRAAGRTPGHSASPEALVAGLVGAGMGLLLYGPYLQVALGQGPSRWARTRSELVTLIRRLMLRAERQVIP
jgi:AcrR family transcriptional regulator